MPKPAMMDPDYRAPILPNQHMEGEQEEEQDQDPHANCRVGDNSYLAIDCLEEDQEEDKEDPHANYRVGDNSYLGIDCLGKYCIQHDTPPSFSQAQGIVIKPYKRSRGLHQFMVTKPDAGDTVDIVYVGTIMVQNGYAYISGKMVLWEHPPICRCVLKFPPFAFKIPRKIPAGVTPEDHDEQLRKQQEDELRKFIIEVKWFDITLPRVLDFRFPRVPSIYPTCSDCGAELSRRDEEKLPDRCCSNCGFESLQLEFTVDAETVDYKTWLQLKKMDHALGLKQAMQAKQHLEMVEQHLEMVEQPLEKVELMESASRDREAELEAEVLKCRNEIEELRSKLMEKEQLLKGKAQLDPSHNRKRVTVASLFNDDQGDRLIDNWIGTYKRKKQKKNVHLLRRVGGMLRKKDLSQSQQT